MLCYLERSCPEEIAVHRAHYETYLTFLGVCFFPGGNLLCLYSVSPSITEKMFIFLVFTLTLNHIFLFRIGQIIRMQMHLAESCVEYATFVLKKTFFPSLCSLVFLSSVVCRGMHYSLQSQRGKQLIRNANLSMLLTDSPGMDDELVYFGTNTGFVFQWSWEVEGTKCCFIKIYGEQVCEKCFLEKSRKHNFFCWKNGLRTKENVLRKIVATNVYATILTFAFELIKRKQILFFTTIMERNSKIWQDFVSLFCLTAFEWVCKKTKVQSLI